MRISAPRDASLAVLTDAETRAAEQSLFDRGASPETLMERAGAEIAGIVAERLTGATILVACGPGNNGGDGYVVARLLRERGFDLRVAALAEPRTGAARLARAKWSGPVEAIAGVPEPADVLIDAVFGSGQTRPPEPELVRWLGHACTRKAIAIDLPTGIRTDTGEGEIAVGGEELIVVAVGAFKPAHLLGRTAERTSALILAPIGLPVPRDHPLRVLVSHGLTEPDAAANKYRRGKVVIVGGRMAGAAHLAAIAAQRSGAGYVELVLDDAAIAPPYALVRRAWSPELLADGRIGAVAIGPGLEDGAEGRARLARVLELDRPVVLDAGALAILATIGIEAIGGGSAIRVLTPHQGEFERLFGAVGSDRIGAVRAAARRSGAIVVLKGNVTIVAHPDGRAALAPPASAWLATAGTGDVLTGIVATMLAQAGCHGLGPFEAVEQALWLHARAADLAGRAMIADDLLVHLAQAVSDA